MLHVNLKLINKLKQIKKLNNSVDWKVVPHKTLNCWAEICWNERSKYLTFSVKKADMFGFGLEF